MCLFRYLACVMEIATPTEDCLVLINELLLPIFKARDENALNRQEVFYSFQLLLLSFISVQVLRMWSKVCHNSV